MCLGIMSVSATDFFAPFLLRVYFENQNLNGSQVLMVEVTQVVCTHQAMVVNTFLVALMYVCDLTFY